MRYPQKPNEFFSTTTALSQTQKENLGTSGPSEIQVIGDFRRTARLQLAKDDIHQSGLSAADNLKGVRGISIFAKIPFSRTFHALYGVVIAVDILFSVK